MSPETSECEWGASLVDATVGFRVPRDLEPARLVRCERNGRYLYEVTEATGPVTVARHHARRFPSKAAAWEQIAKLLMRPGSPADSWKVVRLKAKR